MTIIHAQSSIVAATLEEAWVLVGTSGVPIMATDFQTAPNDAQAGWVFNTDGTLDKVGLGAGFYANFSNKAPSPIADLWVRSSANAGSRPTSGSALDTWLQVVGGLLRAFYWDEGFGSYTGSEKFELATDSGGVTIVATGYYGGTATVEP